MSACDKNCILTGSTGFLGTYLKGCLERNGWNVICWDRRSEDGPGRVHFRLGQSVDPEKLKGAQALIHCAYDLEARTWSEIHETNVAGSQRLFEAARSARIGSMVLVSSISAFPGCRSMYGRSKLLTEQFARDQGGLVLRPGLIYGDTPGGMFGRLVQQARVSHFIPIPWGGRQTQYMVHQDDLGAVIEAALQGQIPGGTDPITVAHARGWELQDLLGAIAHELGSNPKFIPVPWQLAWAGLKTLEAAGIRPAFRSDSLLSMVYQAPKPSFELLARLGLKCRPFSPQAVAREFRLAQGA